MTYHMVAGTTSALEFQLLEDNVPLAESIQGWDVELVLYDKHGRAVDTDGAVTNTDDGSPPTRGWVRVNLDAGDLDERKSPYAARFLVIDTAEKVGFFPTADADVWIVGRGAA